MSGRREWVIGALRRRYERSGVRGLVVLLFAIAIPLSLAYLYVSIFLGAKYLGVDVARNFEWATIWLPAYGAVALLALFHQRAQLKTAVRWSRGDQTSELATETWIALQALPRTIVTMAFLFLPLYPAMALHFAAWHDLDAWTGALSTAASATYFAGLFVLLYYVVELVLWPAREDVARFLPEQFRPVARRTSLDLKLAAAYPAGAFFSGLIVAAYAHASDSLAIRVAVSLTAVLAGVGVSMAIVLFASQVILAPLGELKAAMGRVRSGDYATTVPVVSSDELGDLAQTFNLMLAGLREREEMREELRASRARIVAASDGERRRIERNIHDGAQQHLVGLAVKLRVLEDRVEDPELRSSMAAIQDRLRVALEELRELARGLHPSVLTTDGLEPALAHLAEHSAIPVEIDAPDLRFPEMIESTAYYVASEGLANVAKYAHATNARVHVNADNGSLIVTVTDDGIGGAHAEPGSGLAGLKDRVEAIDGRLTITSPAGHGTRLVAELPLT